MKLILASNVLEHPAFADFARAALDRYPDAGFLVSGDLLNVFPEPGENLEGSIFHELYGGNLITSEMERLVETRFKDASSSPFLGPLRDMFLPTGPRFADATAMARARYDILWSKLRPVTRSHAFHCIPGNMDYPRLLEQTSASYPQVQMMDGNVVVIDGVRVGGVGGVPNTAHPFRGITEISPYEMTDAEYERRLQALWGVDILVTHLSPQECPALETFVKTSPLQVLICRAPFNFNRASDFRGKREIQQLEGKSILQVRPFDFPVNEAFVLNVEEGKLSNPLDVEVFRWQLPHHELEWESVA